MGLICKMSDLNLHLNTCTSSYSTVLDGALVYYTLVPDTNIIPHLWKMANIIPHLWKMANIIPIPPLSEKKPTQPIGILYRPISIFSTLANNPKPTILLYITNNIPNVIAQHNYKAEHSIDTASHNINITIVTGFNQKKSTTCTITVT